MWDFSYFINCTKLWLNKCVYDTNTTEIITATLKVEHKQTIQLSYNKYQVHVFKRNYFIAQWMEQMMNETRRKTKLYAIIFSYSIETTIIR